jgi:hypothetical protein
MWLIHAVSAEHVTWPVARGHGIIPLRPLIVQEIGKLGLYRTNFELFYVIFGYDIETMSVGNLAVRNIWQSYGSHCATMMAYTVTASTDCTPNQVASSLP